MKKSDYTKYEGKCIGIADGKVVIASRSVNKVMKTLIKDYSDCDVTLTSIPKRNKILIL